MQNVSFGGNLHELSKPIFGENKKIILKCLLLNVYYSMLSFQAALKIVARDIIKLFYRKNKAWHSRESYDKYIIIIIIIIIIITVSRTSLE